MPEKQTDGVKTSEFWTMLGATLYSAYQQHQNQIPQNYAPIITAALPAIYIIARTLLKKK